MRTENIRSRKSFHGLLSLTLSQILPTMLESFRQMPLDTALWHFWMFRQQVLANRVQAEAHQHSSSFCYWCAAV
ncbi:unnamed protein product [Cylicostephanus goldi]|uniref:Uncharacterized protein n=1 Tax=Cylicostephanus goldi TaxID=71465 RepID=A0A3P6TZ23_CYLGO|nr:unnamed protein product [Cylicostephanus goldi]